MRRRSRNRRFGLRENERRKNESLVSSRLSRFSSRPGRLLVFVFLFMVSPQMGTYPRMQISKAAGITRGLTDFTRGDPAGRIVTVRLGTSAMCPAQSNEAIAEPPSRRAIAIRLVVGCSTVLWQLCPILGTSGLLCFLGRRCCTTVRLKCAATQSTPAHRCLLSPWCENRRSLHSWPIATAPEKTQRPFRNNFFFLEQFM